MSSPQILSTVAAVTVNHTCALSSQDLDDALHCTELSPGVFEVGVHIADVSFFVEAGTALDSEAADRATSVYLVQRVSGLGVGPLTCDGPREWMCLLQAVSMLPKKLCEDLCSLNPNEVSKSTKYISTSRSPSVLSHLLSCFDAKPSGQALFLHFVEDY